MPRLTQMVRSGKFEFGNMRRDIRHVVYQQISPYEVKAFKGFFTDGVPNVFRRIRSRMVHLFVPPIFALILVDWAKKENEKFHRKNPKDYENDV